MLGPILALASAAVYGMVDFAGGLLSRRVHFAMVALVGQIGALLIAVAIGLVYDAPAVGPVDLLWGSLSGVGSGITMLFLNRGISRGAMSVVVPISAVTGVALSVACGVVLIGDRPSLPAWIGIVLVIPALWWVAGGTARAWAPGVSDGLIASCGVAVQYLALAQAADGSGIWPIAAGRVVAIGVILVPVARARLGSIPPADLVRAAAIGAGATIGLALYLLATRQQLITVAVVLASLYPALPVVLGVTLLRESLSRRQVVGLICAGAAIVLLSIG